MSSIQCSRVIIQWLESFITNSNIIKNIQHQNYSHKEIVFVLKTQHPNTKWLFCGVSLFEMFQILLLFMDISKRHQTDLKQIKSLLAELRKAKLKCLELTDHLNRDLPKLEKYQILEVRCTRTAESMDKLALIQLRNQLTQSLSQLYAEERLMMLEIEKNSFKKVMRPIPARRQRQRCIKQEVGPFKIPFYYNRPQPSINKIQRIANYIESIGKSMDSLRKSMENDGNWDCQDFLQYQPEYQEIIRKIQEFKMRDQELIQSLGKKVEEEKTKLINEAIKGEEDGEFIIMKVPKKKIDYYGRPQQERKEAKTSRSFEQDISYHPLSMIEPKVRNSGKKHKLQKINEEGNLEQSKNYPFLTPQTESLQLPITSFDKKLSANRSRTSKLDNSGMDQDENGNFVYVVKKLSPDSQINSSIMSSISSLRSLRKKVFDDDIWDQFQKF